MTTDSPRRHPGLLRRGAVGFWFLAIGALGLLRGLTRALRDGVFQADLITWIWIAGSSLIVLVGVVVVARAASRQRR